MPATTFIERPPGSSGPAPPSGRDTWRPPFATGRADDWPHTNRWIPWLLAAFLVMVWFVPFDSTELRLDGPVDLKLDRLLMVVIAIAWIGSVFAGGRAAPRWQRSPLEALVLLFVAVAVASVVLNVTTLATQNELTLASKKISVLLSWAVLFFVAATTLRPRELPRFAQLFLGLALVVAAGALWQRYVGPNKFFEWWQVLSPDAVFELARQPNPGPGETFKITGPTRHPLALASMLAMAFPFAILALARSRTAAAKTLYFVACALLMAAIFATGRKTGSYAGIAAVLGLVALRPRLMLRFAPGALVVFVALLLVQPRAVEYQIDQIAPSKISQGASGQARQSDYDAVVPDVRRYLATGRGYGTYDSGKYRILDNNFMVLLLEVGLIGVALAALMILAVPAIAARAARSSDLTRAGPALGAAAGAIAFAMAMLLFDALAFAQVPYLFFFLAAVAVVSSSAMRSDREGAVGLPAMADRAEQPTEALPPLTAEPADQALPVMVDELERERSAVREREQQHEHGGRTRRRLPSRRAAAGRGTPIREHVSAPLPGAPAEEPPASGPSRASVALGRVRAGGGRARRGASRAVRGRAGTAMLSLAALAVAVLAFGRGGTGTEAPGTPQLGAGGGGAAGEDPFGLGEFDEGAGAGSRGGAGEDAAGDTRLVRRAPARGRTAVPVIDIAPAPGPARPRSAPRRGGEEGVRGEERGREREEPRRKPRKPRRPRNPGTGDAPATPPPAPPGGEQPQPDCLPGNETETLLTGIGVDPCALVTPATRAQVRNAFAEGRLNAQELAYVVDMLRRAQGSR